MTKVVCIEGDGIGPEVTRAMKRAVAATGAPITWVDMPAGMATLASHGDPLPTETVEAIATHRVAIKGPTGTPLGGGHESINVRLRQHFQLYSGLRPYRTLPFPLLRDRPTFDIALYRQNTDGLYKVKETLIEDGRGRRVVLEAVFWEDSFRRTATHAFRDAFRESTPLVTLITKSNIHKVWGAMYAEIFDTVAKDYAGYVDTQKLLIDNAAALIVSGRLRSGVIVTENMFGDILADMLAAMVGGLGVAPGANIGDGHAIFEAVHGTAPDIAGRDLANPTALMLSSAMLLDHLGHGDEAMCLRTAIEDVIADGMHATGDVLALYPKGTRPCTTSAFTDAVCARIAALSKRA